jgi:hypothetical protein
MQEDERLCRLFTSTKHALTILAAAVSSEMGAPAALATNAQVPFGLVHFTTALDTQRVTI